MRGRERRSRVRIPSTAPKKGGAGKKNSRPASAQKFSAAAIIFHNMNQEISNLTRISKRNVWLWAFYDFANSLAFVNVSFYFALWLVSDKGASDIWISIPVALSTIALFFTLPAFGRISDRIRRRMPFLRAFTLITALFLFLLGLLAINITSLTFATLISLGIIYFLFQYFYQASLGFYSAFLQDLAVNKTREEISGLGIAAGQIGNVVGLLLLFPLAQGKLSLFGAAGKPVVFLAAALLFLIFSLPVLIFLKDKPRQVGKDNGKISIGKSFSETLKDLRRIRQYPGVFVYLVTYYLFADAVLTLNLFASLYLEKVGGLTDKHKITAFVAGLLLAMIGALVSGKIAKLLKSTKKAIAIFIALLAGSFVALALAFNLPSFLGFAALNGFSWGALFALSRAFYSQLVPSDKQGEFFGIYVLFERLASILGPLVWSGTILALVAFDEATRYRFAMFALAILVAISFFVLRFVKEPSKPIPANSQPI